MINILSVLRSMKRNFSMTLASTILVSLTLIVLGSVIAISTNATNMADELFESLKIVAYVEKDATEEDIEVLMTDIKNIPGVADVEFLSDEEELNNLLGIFDNPEAVATVFESENPLNASVRVSLNDTNVDMQGITDQLTNVNNIEKVVDGSEFGAFEVSDMIEFLKNLMIFVSVALFIVTIFLITNTIKLTINSRRKEISIMKLVGAKNSFIKAPFVVEGLIIGTIGGFFALVLCGLAYSEFLKYDISNFIKTSLLTADVLIYSYLIYLPFIGMFIGIVGSLIAIRSYLKV